MSGLIKAELARTRSRPLGLGLASTSSEVAGAAPADPFAPYKEQVAELEAELAALKKSVPDLIDKAREEGRKAGLQERDDLAAKKLGLIEAGLGEAVSGWTAGLGAMNALSVQVAKTVLKKMIGNADWHGDYLAQAIAARLEALDRSAVIAVKLSAADISADEIAKLNAGGKFQVEADRDLGAGECTIELQMGTISLGPASQWRHAAELLDALCEPIC